MGADKKTIAALTVQIKSDASKFQSGMEKASKRMNKFKGDMKKAGTVIAKNFIAPIAAASAAMLIATNQAAEYADTIDKASIRTGLHRDTLQELAYVADQAGVNYSTIEGSITKLTRAMGDAQMGSKRQTEAFKTLGVSIYETDGSMRKMADVFPEVIQRLSGISNETQRNALSMELFGRSANGLVPLLAALGTDGMDQLSKKAHSLGLVMSGQSLNELVVYKDALSTVKQQLAAATREGMVPFANFMTNSVIPVLGRAIGAYRELITVPVSKKLQEERTELNLLTKSLIASTDNEKARSRIIEEINKKYPSFLKGLDTEKIGLDDIKKRLELVNEQYKDRIRLMITSEDAAEQEKKLNELYREQDAQIKKITESFNYLKSNGKLLNDAYDAETYEEMVEALRSAGKYSDVIAIMAKNAAKNYADIKAEITSTETEYEGLLNKRLHMEGLIADKIKEQGDLLNRVATVQNTNVTNLASATDSAPISNKAISKNTAISNPYQMDSGLDTSGMKAQMEWVRATRDELLMITVDMQAAFQGMTSMVTDSFAESLEAIGNGTGGLGDLFNGILETVADFCIQFGKSLVAAGLAKIAFDNLMWSGPGAVAAGLALVAAASVVKGVLSKGPSGGGSGGGSVAAAGNGISGDYVASGANGINIPKEIVLTARGDQLQAVIETHAQIKGR